MIKKISRKEKFLKKIKKAYKDPKAILIKMLQSLIDSLRDYSYDFNKNGERNVLSRLSKFDLKMVFDVGANVGDWSLIAKEFFQGAEIHSFELSKSTFKTLSRNLSKGNFFPNNMGLGSADTTIAYKDYGADSVVNTLLTNATYHDNKTEFSILQAEIKKGDTYCVENGIKKVDFLKIDVEGAEHLVLQGFEEMLKSGAIRVVQFEYGYTNGDAKFLMRDFYELLNSYGYVVGRISKGGVDFMEWTYKHNDFRSGPNYLAAKADDQEMISALSR